MPKLFMTLIGCDVPGRNIEQHDIFFGIGNELKDLAPAIKQFWPEGIKIHLDAWRVVTKVDRYSIRVVEKYSSTSSLNPHPPIPHLPLSIDHLFFINLGGYKKNEFEEYHYRMLAVAPDKGAAIQQSKQTAFFKHTGLKGAESHVDDKYGVDVDGVVEIKEILQASIKEKYEILIEPARFGQMEDEINLGYFILDKL